MKIREYPAKDDRPHILTANFLADLGLKVKTKWHHWDDLFSWGWQVRGYERNRQGSLFRKRWNLVLDIWPGEFDTMSWAFNKGCIRVLNDKFEDQAKNLASQIEERFGNSITVTTYR